MGSPATDGMPLVEWIKVGANIATVLIALVNIAFAVYFFVRKDRKENKDKKRDIHIAWFKNLILDYTMEHFYGFFENLESIMDGLAGGSPSRLDKQNAEAAILAEEIKLRKKFIDTLLAVDSVLYQRAIDAVDQLTDELKASIVDPGINLSHKPKFEEKVLKPLSETRTDILKLLFAYEGGD